MLSEQAQITACKYLGQLLADYINSFGEYQTLASGEPPKKGTISSDVQTIRWNRR